MRIFHTSDNHIGMTFNRYPDGIREKLVDQRLKSLENMVVRANEEGADLFVVAGDLFNSLRIKKSLITDTAQVLSKFSGACVLVLPGNHDYYTENEELWKLFLAKSREEVVLINENKPFDLRDYGLSAMVYPAVCDSKHSKENKLAWIRQVDLDENLLNICLAHGAFEGITPDIEGNYFYMSRKDLTSLNMDLCLIGHTHVPYPEDGLVREDRIFNAGTHEPDGMNYRLSGSAFIIDIDDKKYIRSRRLETGHFLFRDEGIAIASFDDLENKLSAYKRDDFSRTLLRLNVKGYLEEEFTKSKNELFKSFSEGLFYSQIIDQDLKLTLKKEDLNKYFVDGSFPLKFLENVIGQDDQDLLQKAFELVEGARGD